MNINELNESLYYFIVSLIGSYVLILLAKVLLDRVLRKPADYYEKDEIEEENRMLAAAGLSKTGRVTGRKGADDESE